MPSPPSCPDQPTGGPDGKAEVPSGRLIDEPAEGGKSGDREDGAPRPAVPSLFGMPSRPNYHSRTGLVHCRVSRCGKNCYHLSFQARDAEAVSMIANKVKTSRTPNYHLFDALRGGADAKLSKKACHYIGKLRRDKGRPAGCYALYNSSREKEQVAAYAYDIPPMIQQITERQPPRKMITLIPKHAPSSGGKGGRFKRGSAVASKSANQHSRLMEHLLDGTWERHELVAAQTRPAECHEGQYRLDFSGRVLRPSVKNMQLEDKRGECLLQFGRVGEQTFHLDYKAPFTAFSAFGAALCQFDV